MVKPGDSNLSSKLISTSGINHLTSYWSFCLVSPQHYITSIKQTDQMIHTKITIMYAQQFNSPLSAAMCGTTQVSQYQKSKTNLDFIEVRDSEWQWHQLGHMQVCTLLQTCNHASTPQLSFLQAGCPSCNPTNSIKALKAITIMQHIINTEKLADTRYPIMCQCVIEKLFNHRQLILH